MHDIYWLGSAPAEENCAQTTDPDFATRNKAECLAYIKAIRRVIGPEPEGARLAVKLESGHDFGSYREVVVYFDGNNREAAEYASRCEDKAPLTWAEAEMEQPSVGRGR